MKRNIAMKWIKALESGDYSKGVGQLRDEDDNFCCLGVLCNLHAQEFPAISKHEVFKNGYLGEFSYLPLEVMRWSGVSSYDGAFVSRTAPGLVAANDSGFYSFKEIAEIIRNNYKLL